MKQIKKQRVDWKKRCVVWEKEYSLEREIAERRVKRLSDMVDAKNVVIIVLGVLLLLFLVVLLYSSDRIGKSSTDLARCNEFVSQQVDVINNQTSKIIMCNNFLSDCKAEYEKKVIDIINMNHPPIIFYVNCSDFDGLYNSTSPFANDSGVNVSG